METADLKCKHEKINLNNKPGIDILLNDFKKMSSREVHLAERNPAETNAGKISRKNKQKKYSSRKIV